MSSMATCCKTSLHLQVDRVNYPGLASSPHHSVAMQLFGGRAGGVVSFVLKGPPELTQTFLEARRQSLQSTQPLLVLVTLSSGPALPG